MNFLTGINHGWHNIIVARGGTITIIGMLLVFFSLSIISIIIGLTPYLLKVINRFYPETEESISSGKSSKTLSDNEVAAAVATALIYSMK